jgi:hypothetical protein
MHVTPAPTISNQQVCLPAISRLALREQHLKHFGREPNLLVPALDVKD